MLAVVALASSTGCYLQHGREDAGPPTDAPRRDALDAPIDAPRRDGGRDAPVRDTLRRDVPLRDVPATGEPCARDLDCDEAFCVLDTTATPRDRADVELVCGGAGFVAPGQVCDDNLECENGLCALAGGCVDPCVTDADCRDGERCAETVPIVTSDRTLQFARACARWVDVPDRVDVTENEDIAVSPFSSEAFDVPASMAGHRLILHVTDRVEAFRSIDRLSIRGGITLFDIGGLGFSDQINPAVGFFDVAEILIPIAPWPSGANVRSALAYAMTTGSETEHHRIVMAHDTDGGRLDINVFFVGVRPTASVRRALSAMLSSYEDILGTYDVTMGTVRQFQMVGETGDTFAILDTEDEAAEMFRLSVGAPGPAVDLFLISSSPLFLGLAGGIPGAMGAHGTGASGVTLSMDDLMSAFGDDGPQLAVTLAHEIGHFSGLFHSTETDGTSFEPLTDTPVCDIGHDDNGDGFVTVDECVDADGNNIMFWGPFFPDSSFSPSQRDITGSAPMLRP